jgi:hypothetical protein
VFCGLSELIAHLRRQTIAVMSLNRVQFCVGRIETARLAISGKTDVEHVQSLEAEVRQPDLAYPSGHTHELGGQAIERRARRGRCG